MRFTDSIGYAVLAVMLAAAASAQTPAPSAAAASAAVGEIDFGVRLTAGLDEVGRYQLFTDPRSGPTVDRLRYARDRETWQFTAAFDRMGYRDQRYRAEFERFGKVKASFDWTQVPLWYGGVSASPFRESSTGVFRLDDATQLAVQNRTGSIADYGAAVVTFDTRSRRDTATARITYSASRSLDLNASFTRSARAGSMPYSASFGFTDAVELPVTVDTTTNDVSTSAEWSNRRGMVRVGYDGSFFSNANETLIWDNPLRATDVNAGEGSSQGRLPLWPDSTAHTVSAAGSVALPARSRAFASVSVGRWLQDEQLLPHTINSAITPIPLPRDSAEGDARILSMLYRVTSRPAPMVWISGQYRLYDYDNRTPHFAVDQYVRLDGNTATSATGGSEPFEMTRHFVDVDASITPASLGFIAFRAGYAREHDDRTFRVFENTTENIVRASIDSRGLSWGSVRLLYDHAVRTGDGLDEEVLSDIGEQVSLRQFDISDRTRDRVSALLQVMASSRVGLNASAAIGQENRPDVAFGLQDNDLTSFSVGADFAGGMVDAGFTYAFDTLGTRQKSRQANPGAQFNDPTRDWFTTLDEDVHTVTATLGLPNLGTRTRAQLAYDFVHSNAQYLYELAPNSTLAPPSQLPAVLNESHRASVDVRHTLSTRLALGVGYRLDKYVTNDFGRSEATLNTALIPAYMNILYRWVPYDIHSAVVRLMYHW